MYVRKTAYKNKETSVKFSRMDGSADLESATKSSNRTRVYILWSAHQISNEPRWNEDDSMRTSPVFTIISDTNRWITGIESGINSRWCISIFCTRKFALRRSRHSFTIANSPSKIMFTYLQYITICEQKLYNNFIL